MPSRSTKAPKSTMLEMVPVTRSPTFMRSRICSRTPRRSSSSTARRLRTTLLRKRLSSMTRHSQRLAQELVQIGHPADVDQRGGQEAAHAQVEDETALDHFDDRALDRGAFFGGLLDALPGTLEAGPLLGQDQPAVGVLFGEHEGVDDVAHRRLLRRDPPTF